jgi:RecB family exonuclease
MARIISLTPQGGKELAKVPERWSYSAATSFAECPRKWYLKQVRLAEFDGPLPQPLGKSALEGTLLHELLKCFSLAPTDFRPRKQLRSLVEVQRDSYQQNPRVNIDRLVQRVSIDSILNNFHRFHLRVNEVSPAFVGPKDRSKSRKFGAEVYVKDPESKLFGIIDYIDQDGLTDFKTGEKSDDHDQQVLLYGALWKAQWNEVPTQLSVMYAGDQNSVEFSPSLLDEVLSQWRKRVHSYDTSISAETIPTNPSAELCARCSLRPMCPDYWKIVYPEMLGSWESKTFTDFMPTSEAAIDKTALGVYVRDRVHGKDVSLLVDSPVGSDDLNLASFRALGLQLRQSDGRLQLIANEQSELFSDCPTC